MITAPRPTITIALHPGDDPLFDAQPCEACSGHGQVPDEEGQSDTGEVVCPLCGEEP